MQYILRRGRIEKTVWGDKAICPYCQNMSEAERIRTDGDNYTCRVCKKVFKIFGQWSQH